MSLLLADILTLDDLKKYKAHCAVWNGEHQPLDVFVRDRKEWENWNTYRGKKNDFNRPYIFSLMSFYPEADTWLFGGIYEVLKAKEDSYEVRLTEQAVKLIGRLKLSFKLVGRNRRLKLEGCFSEFVVSEILKAEYTGEAFSGYEDIDLSFDELDLIVKNKKADWQGALQNIKGVYLITDKKSGKRYVGSAYGEYGIWSRLVCYLQTGHGGNDGLTKLIKKKGMDYARQNYKFTLLEYRPTKVDDKVIIKRESFWKRALLTRGDYGFNMN